MMKIKACDAIRLSHPLCYTIIMLFVQSGTKVWRVMFVMHMQLSGLPLVHASIVQGRTCVTINTQVVHV